MDKKYEVILHKYKIVIVWMCCYRTHHPVIDYFPIRACHKVFYFLLTRFGKNLSFGISHRRDNPDLIP